MDTGIFLQIGTGLKWLGLLSLPLFLLPLIALSAPRLVDGFALKISRLIDRVTGMALGAAMASALILVFAMLAVVILRYTFSLSFSWLSEITTYAFAAMFMLGAAAALRDGAHVRVDIFYGRLSPKGRAWVDIFGVVFLLMPWLGLLAWTAWTYVTYSWATGEVSVQSNGMPGVYVLKSMMLAFVVLLGLQGLAWVGRSVLVLAGRTPPAAETLTGPLG
jgi:TRAP-type mannitol/chloroaromatic compound transport system permease small subunit